MFGKHIFETFEILLREVHARNAFCDRLPYTTATFVRSKYVVRVNISVMRFVTIGRSLSVYLLSRFSSKALSYSFISLNDTWISSTLLYVFSTYTLSFGRYNRVQLCESTKDNAYSTSYLPPSIMVYRLQCRTVMKRCTPSKTSYGYEYSNLLLDRPTHKNTSNRLCFRPVEYVYLHFQTLSWTTTFVPTRCQQGSLELNKVDAVYCAKSNILDFFTVSK